jgi:hypothetical protein
MAATPYLNSPYQHAIKLKAANVYVNDTNVPVVLSEVGIEDFLALAYRSDGKDIVVTDVDGNLIPREIVQFDRAAKTIELHYLDPAVSTVTGGTQLYLQCGSTTANVANSTAVWSDYYRVLHFNETAANLTDATGNCSPVDLSLTYSQASKIKNSVLLDGDDSSSNLDYIDGLDGSSEFSIGLWIKPADLSEIILLYRLLKLPADFYCQLSPDGTLYVSINAAAWVYNTYTTYIAVGSWTYFVISYNSGSIKVYANGVNKPETMSGVVPATVPVFSPSKFLLGFDATYSFNGLMDEFRFKKTAISENQIKTQYDIQNGFDTNATFTIGALVDLTLTITDVTPAVSLIAGGFNAVFTGSNFMPDGVTWPEIKFGTYVLTSGEINTVTDTEISVDIPAHAIGVIDITITNSFGFSDTIPFEYIEDVSVTSIDPNSGVTTGGYTIDINGSGFKPTGKPDPTVSMFLVVPPYTETSLNVVSATNTKVVVDIPAGTEGSKLILVTNYYNYTDAAIFEYIGAIAITSVDAVSGLLTRGSIAKITGTHFKPDGSTCPDIEINGVAVSEISCTDNEIILQFPDDLLIEMNEITLTNSLALTITSEFEIFYNHEIALQKLFPLKGLL